MVVSARSAFDYLRREGVALERIAGLSNTCVSAVRQWLHGEDIPTGAATRLVVAARVVAALKLREAPVVEGSGQNELAEFAKRWLACHRPKSEAAGLNSRHG
jgi:hypothetical protein